RRRAAARTSRGGAVAAPEIQDLEPPGDAERRDERRAALAHGLRNSGEIALFPQRFVRVHGCHFRGIAAFETAGGRRTRRQYDTGNHVRRSIDTIAARTAGAIMKRVLSGMVIVIASAGIASAQSGKRPLSLDDLAKIKDVRDPQ